MNQHLRLLQPYPFERLSGLLGDCRAADLPPVNLAIGEPRHPPPDFLVQKLADTGRTATDLGQYPPTRGRGELRTAITAWIERRWQLAAGSLDPETEVLPVNGTREALFAIAQTLVAAGDDSLVMMPNPCYQIYEGAALLAGAGPSYLPCTGKTDFLPDFAQVSSKEWQKCQLLYICSPGNPTGAVMDRKMLIRLIQLADEFDFFLVADECYSEIYPDDRQPPDSLLAACIAMGRHDFRRCLVLNSLSKRSSLPGLRSGFVAGDADIIRSFLLYRSYHGSAMPSSTQTISTLAWQDEEHVAASRSRYRCKTDDALALLGQHAEVQRPDGGFYLWLKTPGDDENFARELFCRQNLTVLPGSYLGRPVKGLNPGAGYVRIALVAGEQDCRAAIKRLVKHLKTCHSGSGAGL